jgi:hypothetical protein
MGYTWENVTRIAGASGTNLGRHMKLHPCCKKQTKKAVVHPFTNRPLIVNALPVELQARIHNRFGENPPQFHPFPRPLESIFEVQVHIQVVLTNDRMTMLMNRTNNKRMKRRKGSNFFKVFFLALKRLALSTLHVLNVQWNWMREKK